MASIRKRGARWEARIRRKGYPTRTKTFRTRMLAERWVRECESDMERNIFRDTTLAERMTVREMLDRYVKEAEMRGEAGSIDRSRIRNLKRHLGDYAVINITPERIAKFRNDRLYLAVPEGADPKTASEIARRNADEKRVGPASVTREMNTLSSVFKLAISEWGVYLPHGNPVSVVRRPKKPRGRERRTDEQELARLAACSDSDWLLDICLFALETAMRRGEIAAMVWQDVDFVKRRIHIPHTKTGKPRTIPLTQEARDILLKRPGERVGPVWGVRGDSITQAFNRARDRAGIEDLHFHDLRHEATSRFFELGLDDMKVAKITGHRDWRSLERYTHLKPDMLANEIDAARRGMRGAGEVIDFRQNRTRRDQKP